MALGPRETTHVFAYDAQQVADALLVLLPQLGIPVDTVGVIGQMSPKPSYSVLVGPGSDSAPPAGPDAGGDVGSSSKDQERGKWSPQGQKRL